MPITPGWTVKQIRDFVYAYERLPYGTKTAWLAAQGVSPAQVRRWRDTIFDGDLDAGLIPRQGGDMTSRGERRQLVRQEAAHAVEIEQLQARVQELETVNEALGKAIGLLHKLSEQEPTVSTMNEPEGLSPQRTSW